MARDAAIASKQEAEHSIRRLQDAENLASAANEEVQAKVWQY